MAALLAACADDGTLDEALGRQIITAWENGLPYIKREDRLELDEHLRHLIESIGDRPGHLNYAISILMRGFAGETPGYATMSEAHSQAVCAAAEYYRTELARYEDAKQVANGPLVVPR